MNAIILEKRRNRHIGMGGQVGEVVTFRDDHIREMYRDKACELRLALQAKMSQLHDHKHGLVEPPSLPTRLKLWGNEKKNRAVTAAALDNVCTTLIGFCQTIETEGIFDKAGNIRAIAEEIKRLSLSHVKVAGGTELFLAFQRILWLMKPIYAIYQGKTVPSAYAFEGPHPDFCPDLDLPTVTVGDWDSGIPASLSEPQSPSHYSAVQSQNMSFPDSLLQQAHPPSTDEVITFAVPDQILKWRIRFGDLHGTYIRRNDGLKAALTNKVLAVVLLHNHSEYLSVRPAMLLSQITEFRSHDPQCPGYQLVTHHLLPFLEQVHAAAFADKDKFYERPTQSTVSLSPSLSEFDTLSVGPDHRYGLPSLTSQIASSSSASAGPLPSHSPYTSFQHQTSEPPPSVNDLSNLASSAGLVRPPSPSQRTAGQKGPADRAGYRPL